MPGQNTPSSVDSQGRKICRIEGCGCPVNARQLCNRHYARLHRRGTVELTTLPFEQRFWARVQKGDGCWLWTGSCTSEGYGQVQRDRTFLLAHRVAYELLRGPVPDGLTIDHVCRVRNCVNPAHLEPVSSRINILRGDGLTAVNSRKDCCIRGHLLAGDNLRITPRGARACRACHRELGRERNRRRRQRLAEVRRELARRAVP